MTVNNLQDSSELVQYHHGLFGVMIPTSVTADMLKVKGPTVAGKAQVVAGEKRLLWTPRASQVLKYLGAFF